MTKPSLAAAALLLLAACSGSKPTWKEHDAGLLTLQFPCDPSSSGTVWKCMRPDGSEYALTTIEKGLTPEDQLAQARQYMEAIPKGEVFEEKGFPLRWREVRQFGKFDFVMYYQDGKELTLSVAYTTPAPPPEAAEFFARVKVKAK